MLPNRIAGPPAGVLQNSSGIGGLHMVETGKEINQRDDLKKRPKAMSHIRSTSQVEKNLLM